MGYLGESYDDKGGSQSSTTMKNTSGDHDALLAVQARPRRQIDAPRVPNLGNPGTRPSWVETKVPAQNHKSEGIFSSLQYLVCCLCYGYGHISQDFIQTLRQLMKAVEYYETLTAIEKAAVPSTSYCRVRAALGLEKTALAKTSSSEQNTSQSAKYDISHYLAYSAQPQLQALLEAPEAQETVF